MRLGYMMKQVQYIFVGLSILLSASYCFAMVFDNRFIPLIQKPFITVEDCYSHAAFNLFAITANRAISCDKEDIGIPELYGFYDQGMLAKSFVAVGCENPLKTEWQGAVIPWYVYGKLQGQGLEFAYEQAITDHISLGFNALVMRINSWQEFILNQEKVSGINLQPTDIPELDEVRRDMQSAIGLCADHAHNAGLGDLDVYIRFNKMWDHYLKFRTIFGGFRFGLLVPASPKHDWNYAAWIPIGGDGHWGIYGRVDAEFEVREDMRVGFLAQLNKRLPRTLVRRMPVLEEPEIFGVLRAPMRVDPGVTFIASPYFSLESIRGGLGLRVFYTLTKHAHDNFCYKGSQNVRLILLD